PGVPLSFPRPAEPFGCWVFEVVWPGLSLRSPGSQQHRGFADSAPATRNDPISTIKQPCPGPGGTLMSRPTRPASVFDVVSRSALAPPFARPSPPDGAAALELLLQGNRDVAAVADAVAGGPGRGRQWVVPCDPRDLGLPDVPGQPPRQQPFALV